jgi:hypothetical protein
MMVKYNSQLELEGMQNNGLLSELRSIAAGDSSVLQGAEYLCDESKQFFDTFYSQDAAAFYRERQEKKRIDISEIVQILRTTKVQQCRGKYHNDRKLCTWAIKHENMAGMELTIVKHYISNRLQYYVMMP